MNLFTKYTLEETKFLLSLTDKKFNKNGIHPIFKGVDTSKLSIFYKKIFKKKELITEYEFILVKSGKVGVVKNGKIVKILKENNLFGVLKTFINKDFPLVTLEDSEVIIFSLEGSEEIKLNLLTYIAKKIDNHFII